MKSQHVLQLPAVGKLGSQPQGNPVVKQTKPPVEVVSSQNSILPEPSQA